MKVINIFEVVKESLYSVQYDSETTHELKRIFDLWNDPEYLEAYFEANKLILDNAFWQGISVEEAVLYTKKEVVLLEEELLTIAESGKSNSDENLSTLFKPLKNNPLKIEKYEKSKLKGEPPARWLRIYAIRIEPNLFLISGGAIKLTKTMNEDSYLKIELQKLEVVKSFLIDGEENEDIDFQIFELYL